MSKMKTPIKILTIILLTLIGLSLLALGWSLDTFYYYLGLSTTGNGERISWIIGGTLTLLLSALFIKSAFKHWAWNILKIVLLTYSAFITFNGQLSKYNDSKNLNSEKTAIEDNKQSLFEQYSEDVVNTKQKIAVKNAILNMPLKERAYLITNGVKPLNKEIADLTVQLDKYEALQEKYSSQLSTSENTEIKNLSSYELLADNLGINSPTLLELLPMVLLSLLIALTAPIGMIILQTIFPQAESRGVIGENITTEKGSNTGNSKPDTVKAGKSNTERSVEKVTRDSVLMYLERWGNEEFPSVLKSKASVCKDTGLKISVCNRITKRATALGLIESSGNGSSPCVRKSEFLLMYKNGARVRVV